MEETVFVPLEIGNLRKGTAEFQRMETRKRSVWYQRGCNMYWHISSASRKNVPARRCERSIPC
jgi:LAS superfamily LD-carboxypeptidase LdcB